MLRMWLQSVLARIKDRFSMLWHKHLGYISKERMNKLIKDDILSILNFGDIKTYIDCIKNKLTKTKKKGTIYS